MHGIRHFSTGSSPNALIRAAYVLLIIISRHCNPELMRLRRLNWAAMRHNDPESYAHSISSRADNNSGYDTEQQ